MSELALEALRRDHSAIRGLADHLRMVAAELQRGPNPALRSVLDSLLETCVRHLFRHMRQEEHVVYPGLTRVLGSEVPVLSLTAEHRNIRAQVGDLQIVNAGRANGDFWSDRIPALRTGVTRLANDLELHIRREEAAFGALEAQRPERLTLVPSSR